MTHATAVCLSVCVCFRVCKNSARQTKDVEEKSNECVIAKLKNLEKEPYNFANARLSRVIVKPTTTLLEKISCQLNRIPLPLGPTVA